MRYGAMEMGDGSCAASTSVSATGTARYMRERIRTRRYTTQSSCQSDHYEVVCLINEMHSHVNKLWFTPNKKRDRTQTIHA
jgi:hypothetical protein